MHFLHFTHTKSCLLTLIVMIAVLIMIMTITAVVMHTLAMGFVTVYEIGDCCSDMSVA